MNRKILGNTDSCHVAHQYHNSRLVLLRVLLLLVEKELCTQVSDNTELGVSLHRQGKGLEMPA